MRVRAQTLISHTSYCRWSRKHRWTPHLCEDEAVSIMGHKPQCGRCRRPHRIYTSLRGRPYIPMDTNLTEGESVSHTGHTSHCENGQPGSGSRTFAWFQTDSAGAWCIPLGVWQVVTGSAMTTFYLIGNNTDSAGLCNSASATCETTILTVIVERDSFVVLITSKCRSQRFFFSTSFMDQRQSCSCHSTWSTCPSYRVSYRKILLQDPDEGDWEYPKDQKSYTTR